MRVRGERTFVTAAFVLYAAVTLFVALAHECWRDEADPWLLIRDGGVSTMLERTGFVGMPALWYLAIAPLVELGLPYRSMTLLNLAFAWAASLLFLVHAPFPRWFRALFVFSYYLSFEYAVIARPYALGLLLLFTALALWPVRTERASALAVAIALVANATPHFLLIAAVLGALSFAEIRFRQPLALAIMLAGGALSVYQLLPPATAPADHIVRGFSLSGPFAAAAQCFLPGFPPWVGVIAAGVVLATTTRSIGARVAPQLFLWLALAGMGFIVTFVWMGGRRHAGLIAVIIVSAVWLAKVYGGEARGAVLAIGVTLVLAVAFAASTWWQELTEPFSGAAEMAAFLRRHDLDAVPIAAHRAAPAEALLPYLEPRTFFFPAEHRTGSYMLWDRGYRAARPTTSAEAVEIAARAFDGRDYLLLLNAELTQARGYRLLYRTAAPFGHPDEQYWLYAPSNEVNGR